MRACVIWQLLEEFSICICSFRKFALPLKFDGPIEYGFGRL